MNRSWTSGGTRQKSYELPLVKRMRMRPVAGSYPMAEMASDETRIMSMMPVLPVCDCVSAIIPMVLHGA